jgi:5-methylcytosine-specific restriction endonuclease McrA
MLLLPKEMFLGTPKDYFQYMTEATWEHIQPKSRGGSNLTDNKKLACRACNWSKNNMTEQQFRNQLEKGFKVPQPWVVKRVRADVRKIQQKLFPQYYLRKDATAQ